MKSTHNTVRAYGKSALGTLVIVAGTALMMAACSTVPTPPKAYSQDLLPENIRVPAGHQVALETTAVGVLNYECKANMPTAGTIGWVLVSPKLTCLTAQARMLLLTQARPLPGRTLTDQRSLAPRLQSRPSLAVPTFHCSLPVARAQQAPACCRTSLTSSASKPRVARTFPKPAPKQTLATS